MTPPRQEAVAGDAAGRAIVFDFGAVVFRWRPEVVIAQALPARAGDAASARHWVGEVFQQYGGDWGDFDRGWIDVDALAARIAARTGLALAEAHAVIAAAPEELVAQPPTVAWIERLAAAGWPLHFLSNMPAPFADTLERRNDFFRHFHSGVFSGRVGLAKPDPAIFALAAQRFGRAPAQLLLLDDHAGNIAAARAAGWQAVLFVDAAQAEAEVRALGW